MSETPTPSTDHVRTAGIGIALGALMAAAIAALALFDRDGPQLAVHFWGRLPVVAIVGMPAILARLGLHRPPALLAAGVLSLPTAFLSLAGATLPLLIPGAFYLVAYGRAPALQGRVPTALVAALAVVVSVGAFATSISDGMEVCTETITYSDGKTVKRVTSRDGQSNMHGGPLDEEIVAQESGCSSQPTPRRAAGALALLTVGALLIAWMSKPTDSARQTHQDARVPSL